MDYLKTILQPPLFLAIGASSFYVFQYLKEHRYLKQYYPGIYAAFEKLKDEKKLTRENGLSELLHYIMEEKDKTEGFNSHCDELYDMGVVKILLGLLKEYSEQTCPIFVNIFNLLHLILQHERSQRWNRRDLMIRSGIIQIILEIINDPKYVASEENADFQFIQNQNHTEEQVLISGLALLRSLTKFDGFRRSVKEEVPVGSQGGVEMMKMEHDLLRIIVDGINHKNPDVVKHCLAIIAHTSRPEIGYNCYGEINGLNELIKRLKRRSKEFQKNLHISAGYLIEGAIESELEVLSKNSQIYKDLIMSFSHSGITQNEQEGILRALYHIVRYNHLKPDNEKRRMEMASQLKLREESLKSIFEMTMNKRRTLRTLAKKFTNILLNKRDPLSKEHCAKFKELYENRIAELRELIAKTPQLKQVQMAQKIAQLQQGMGMQSPMTPMAPGNMQGLFG